MKYNEFPWKRLVTALILHFPKNHFINNSSLAWNQSLWKCCLSSGFLIWPHFIALFNNFNPFGCDRFSKSTLAAVLRHHVPWRSKTEQDREIMAWGWAPGPQIWLPGQFSSSDLACDAFKPLKQIAKKFVQEDICLLVKLAVSKNNY